MDEKTTLKDAAIEYAKRGYSVIPLIPRDKRPLIKWTEFEDFSASIEQVNKWWTETPDANIGIITGSVSGITVLDFDSKDIDLSRAKLIELGFREDLIEKGTVPIVQTGKQGYHFFYSYDDEVITRKIRVNDNLYIDVQNEGRYVVAPPSVHPETGRKYRWIVQCGPPVRPGLADFINNYGQARTDVEVQSKQEPIKEGERNETIFKYASLLRGKGLHQDEISVLVWNMIRTRGVENPETLDEAEVDRTIQSVMRYEPGDGKTASLFVTGENAGKLMTREVPPGKKVGLIGIDKLGGLYKGLYVIAARPGEGKSTYLATIIPKLVMSGMKTYLLTAEMPPEGFGKWMKTANGPDLFRKIVCATNFGVNTKIGPIDAMDLAENIRLYRPEVLILDHIGKLRVKGTENRPLELQFALDELHSAAMDSGCAVIASAHLSRVVDHRAGNRPTMASLRESGAIENSADILVYLYRQEGEDISNDYVNMWFDTDKNRHFGRLGRQHLVMDRPGRRLTYPANEY